MIERARGGAKRERTEEHLCWWPFPEMLFLLLKLTPAETEEGLHIYLFKNLPSFLIVPFGLDTYLSAHDSNSEHLHSLWTGSWEIWMPPVMDITLCLCVPCSGGVHTHEAHVTGWGSTHSETDREREVYLSEAAPEDCPIAIMERMKTYECVEGKWVFSPLEAGLYECLSVNVCVLQATACHGAAYFKYSKANIIRFSN